jgi:hypothetical protein
MRACRMGVDTFFLAWSSNPRTVDPAKDDSAKVFWILVMKPLDLGIIGGWLKFLSIGLKL